MDFTINEENMDQVIVAMYENVKSNQHRIDKMEPLLDTMSTRIEKISHLLIDNGFAKAVESNAAACRGINQQLQTFQLERESTCPHIKREAVMRKEMMENRDWGLRVGLAILSLIGFGLSFYVGILLG